MHSFKTVNGVVDAIISTFKNGTDLFTKWMDIGRGRKKRRENESAEVVLRKAAPSVQNEYDHDIARLGPKFARGDGKDALIPSPE